MIILILLVIVGFIIKFIRSVRLAKVYRESVQAQICFYDDMRTMLSKINNSIARLSEIHSVSYVEELRMYQSCVHCRHLEQCQSDTDLEGEEFDYLICENFSEVIK